MMSVSLGARECVVLFVGDVLIVTWCGLMEMLPSNRVSYLFV